MLASLKTAAAFIILMTFIVGFVYPVSTALIAQTFFHKKANGSLVERDGKFIGSKIVGQEFKAKKYFHSRPSYAGEGYDASKSGASNFAASNNELIFSTNQRLNEVLAERNKKSRLVPADMVMASASGLDPDISVAAAYYQIPRVAKERGIALKKVTELVDKSIDSAWLGIFGNDKINLLSLNLQLDELKNEKASK